MIDLYRKVESASRAIRALGEVCSETMTCLTTVHAVGQRWCASGEVNNKVIIHKTLLKILIRASSTQVTLRSLLTDLRLFEDVRARA